MERYKVDTYFAHSKFCGIQFDRTLGYRIIDTYSDDYEVIHNYRWSKEDAERKCEWLNASISKPLYKVFKNGLNKYFVCYKAWFNNQAMYKDGLIGYNKISHCGYKLDPLYRVSWTPDIGEPKIHVSECDFLPQDALKNGVDTIEEACDMLTLVIEKHDEIEEIQKEWRIKNEKEKVATPVNCV